MPTDGSRSRDGVSRRQYLTLAGLFGTTGALGGRAGQQSPTGDDGTVADYVVTTTDELVAAFESLSDGDTVYVATGVYRPSQWLTVDASDVTIVGESRRGTLIKPEDGANVGGIYVGPDGRVENVRIAGVGFHGNADAMDQSIKRLHGFVVEAATAVTIQRCFATRTSPYHEHDDGGSGFTVRRQARDVALVDNHAVDVGDRSIQVAGRDLLVAGNRLYDGWDRGVNLEVRHPDGRKYFSRHVSVVGNVGRDFSDGDFVGASQVGDYASEAGNYAIVGNVAAGSHRHLVNVTVRDDTRNVVVAGNDGVQGDTAGEWSGIRVGGAVSNVTVAGNAVADYSTHGVDVEGGVSDVTCANNAVSDPARDGVHVEGSDAVVDGNLVRSAGETGIRVIGEGAVVSNNFVTGAGGAGVRLGPSAAPAVVTGNLVRDPGTRAANAAGIRVGATGALVATNRVAAADPVTGLAESESADRNLYVGNLFPDGDAWRITGPESRLFGNVPSPDRRRELGSDDGRAHVEFSRQYGRKPVLEVQTEAPALWGVEWHRDDAGRYVGATVSFEDADGNPVDPVAYASVRAR